MTNQELDKWIAEKVLGWTGCSDNWTPTESISDAFQVVEKMMQDVKCSFDFTYHCELGWRAIFHSCDKEYDAPLKGVLSAPLAICLAAKKAIEA